MEGEEGLRGGALAPTATSLGALKKIIDARAAFQRPQRLLENDEHMEGILALLPDEELADELRHRWKAPRRGSAGGNESVQRRAPSRCLKRRAGCD